MQTESFHFEGPAGRLEAILMHPARQALAAAVVCHAHPQHGGMMHFKAVFRAAKALQQSGVAALRFNFRGVGTSAGRYDDGQGEQDDTRAALDEVTGRFPGLPLVLGGFSFGAAMAMRVGATDDRVRAAFALGLPVAALDDLAFLRAWTKPRLFIQGERDVFGAGERLQSLVAELHGPRSLVVIPGSDHFFDGHLDRLQRELATWAMGRPWASGTGDGEVDTTPAG